MDELKQALEQQRLNGIEEDYIEVLVRALQVRRDVVVRFLYAFECLQHESSQYNVHFPVEQWNELLGDELRRAIERAMIVGAYDVALANAIKSGGGISIPVDILIPPSDESLICNGCPESLKCFAESLSTPHNCYTGAKSLPVVFPLKVVDGTLTLEAKQPAGRYEISLALLQNRIWKMRSLNGRR